MCRAKNGELLTNKNQVLVRWIEHFEEHLNEGSESEQPTRPVDLKNDGVDIDLPSGEGIEGALKYLKNNKAASADSIVAELLKNVELNLADALHEVIQQTWTNETLPRSWTEGYCVHCTKRVINSIVKTVEGFASSTWHTKASPKFYTTASYPNQVNQQQTNSLHCAKS
jgi:hypothetical protein